MRTILGRARSERPELGPTIDLQLELDAVPAPAPMQVPAGFAAAAAARLGSDLPAIEPAALVLDWAALASRIDAMCQILARRDIRVERPVDARELATRFLEGQDVGGPAMTLVMTHALKPFLRPLAEAALALPAARAWMGGHCPACGGPPDLAVLEGEGGARRLLCARCDTEWSYSRIGCPFCENQDPKTLAYFKAGEGPHRLYICERCRRYLKTIDRRETWSDAPLVAERILTAGLDLAAARAGYGPLASSPGS